MTKKTPITQQGFDKVQSELDQLIKVEREEIKVKISEARELGDLKENAEYHAAKERQSIIEGRIAQLQGIVTNSQIIKIEDIKSNTIVFGATVTLYDPEKDAEVVYKIVGEDESNMTEGKISYTSPIGKALIGREVGDEVIVKAPKGNVEYEVVAFEFKA